MRTYRRKMPMPNVTMRPSVRALDAAVGDRTITETAKRWGVPRWVLYDWRRGRIKSLHMRYLPRIADGMNMSLLQLIELLEKENGEDGQKDGDGNG